MAERTIKAVELVREIRDRQAAVLESKSAEEIVDFLRRAGEAARDDAQRWRKRHAEARAVGQHR